MKKESESASRQGDREINSMFTSIQNMARNGDNRYNAKFSYDCICWLNEKFGQSKRFIMCNLLEAGLQANGIYSSSIEEFKREYAFLQKKGKKGRRKEMADAAVLEGENL